MAKAVLMIHDLEIVEHNYGSILEAPEKDVKRIQNEASRIPKTDSTLLPNTYVRISPSGDPIVTDDYRVWKAWHEECYGVSAVKLAKKYHITLYRLSRLRYLNFSYVIRINGREHQYRSNHVSSLVAKLALKGIDAPRSKSSFQDQLHDYSQGLSNCYPGRCKRIRFMQNLIYRTDEGDIRAKIPLSVRQR